MTGASIGLVLSLTIAISAAIGALIGLCFGWGLIFWWRSQAEQRRSELIRHRAKSQRASHPFRHHRRGRADRAQETTTPD